MLRRLGIRGKVLAALSVPVVVLFLLAGLTSWQAVQDVRTTRAVQEVLDALDQASLLAQAVQEERSVSVGLFGPAAADLEATGDLDGVRQTTDTAVNRFRSAARGIDFDSLDPVTRDAFGDIDAQLGVLRSVRSFVDVRQVAMLTVDQAFSGLIDSIVRFPGNVAQSLSDRQLALIVDADAGVQQLMEAYAHEQVLGREVLLNVQAGVIAPTAVNNSDLQAISALIADTDEFRLDVSSAVYDLGTETAIPEVVLTDNQAPDDLPAMRRDLRNLTEVRLMTWAPDVWAASQQEEIEALAVADEEITGLADRRANTVANAALREAALTISVTALAVVLSIVIALSIARAIVRPVRRLTEAAATVRDELPHLVEQVAIPGQGPDLRLTKIPVESRDEIGRLATAFNEVNATTIEVAQEQAALRASIAEMFVNVARRDQVLLNRQLSFIDALERAEEDPKTLADLFRLDHLATRMRRNSESLLVLAGIDTGRRLREPLPTSDVIRTASSEIEHYERIQLELPVDPLMLGHTALPTAHMLAELLENATVFSDPGTPVHVSTGIDETAVIITILDQGLGMTAEELGQANARLQTSSASDVLGAQRLGLYVVGRISARLGASVTLGLGPDGKGTLVTVRMPLVLFVNTDAIPITPPTAAPARVESFVLPEEAAAVAHDTAYAPVPDAVQDVAPGAYGSAENPAQAVDLTALVEGTTGTGLPKRRSHADAAPTWDMSGGDTAAASAIPLAPTPESLAGAAQAQEEVWQPPVVQASTPLVPRRRTEDAPDEAPAAAPLPQRPRTSPSGLPVRGATGSQPPVPQSGLGAPTASGLPTRRPVTGAPVAREAVDASAASGPVNVEGRTAMFAGFRSRRAELAAAAVHEAGTDSDQMDSSDGVERLAAAATGAAAFFQRGGQAPAEATPEAPAEETFVIPALVDDEDEYGDAAFAPGAPAEAVAQAPAAAPEQAEPEAEAAEPAPWAPVEEGAAVAQTEADFAIFAPTPTPSAPGAPAWPPTQAPVAAETPVAETDWTAVPPPTAEPAQADWAAAAASISPVAEEAVAPAAGPVAEPVWAPTMDVSRTHDVVETPMPQRSAPTEAPAAAAPAPAPATPAPAPYSPYQPGATLDFSELVQGPTRRSLRQKPQRRGLFRRSRSKGGEVPTQAHAPAAPAAPVMPTQPAAPPASAPAAESFPVFGTPAPSGAEYPPVTESPVRQSAWGAPQPGVHAEPEQAPQSGWVDTPDAVQPPEAFAPQQPAWAPAEPQWSPPVPPTPGVAAVPEPRSGEGASWQPAPAAGGWEPTPWPQHEQPPVAEPPVAAAPAAPVQPPAAPVQPAAPAPAFGGGTTFTPQAAFGFDEEMTSMLAQRADIASQALAELNQLSTYRPQAVAGSGSSKLVRRTPSAIPAAPAITKPSSPRPARDADQVRSLLSSFQSGTSRGRQASDDGTQTAGEIGHAGGSEGPDGRGEPVTTPDTDLTTREASW